MNPKCLVLWLASVVCLSSMAQSLTTERNAYRAADRIVKQQVAYKDPGSSGKGLIWDFSMLQPINEEYTLDYSIPDSTHKDILSGLEHRTHYYYRQRNDSLWATGFENYTTLMTYTTPELRMRFPFSYGDTLYSAFEGKGEYSHRLRLGVKGYTRIQADAAGELKLPDFETVKKALRVHTLRYYTETGKDSVEMSLDTYAWYAEGIRYPVFESIKTKLIKKPTGTNVQTKDTTVFTTSFYYPPEKQSSQVATEALPGTVAEAPTGAEAVFTEAQLYPNPVVDNLYINFKLTRAAKVWFTVHNNTGIALCQTAAQNLGEGTHDTTVRMAGMIPAVYSLYVHVDDMVMRLNVVKQ